MVKCRMLLAVFVAAACAAVLAPRAGALANAQHTTYLKFNSPVSLPGVTLAPGTYIFELANPASGADVVSVVSRDRSVAYFTGLTRAIARPRGLPATQSLSFGESAVGTPPAITAWWRENERVGRQFLYPSAD